MMNGFYKCTVVGVLDVITKVTKILQNFMEHIPKHTKIVAVPTCTIWMILHGLLKIQVI